MAKAIAEKKPIVALESTIISHGLPRPRNLTVAQEVEAIVRETGATPATIAILDGVIHVGLEEDQLDRIANEDGVVKASTRDLAILAATKKSAATTLAVPVLGYKTNKFPGFYLTESGFDIEHRVDSATDIAAIWNQRKNVNTSESAVIVTNPVKVELDRALHDKLLTNGLAEADAHHITGKAVTPFLLEYFHRVSDGKSLDVNVEIIKSNSRLAAEIAIAL